MKFRQMDPSVISCGLTSRRPARPGPSCADGVHQRKKRVQAIIVACSPGCKRIQRDDLGTSGRDLRKGHDESFSISQDAHPVAFKSCLQAWIQHDL